MWIAPRREPDAREKAKIALGKKISDGVKRAYARRYAKMGAPRILTLLAELGRAEIDIPPTWHVYVPEDIRTRWPSVAHSMGLLADIHREWPYERQQLWLQTLESTASACRAAARKRAAEARVSDPSPEAMADDDDDYDYRSVREKFEAGEYGGLWGWAAAAAPIPDEDAAALAELGDLA